MHPLCLERSLMYHISGFGHLGPGYEQVDRTRWIGDRQDRVFVIYGRGDHRRRGSAEVSQAEGVDGRAPETALGRG
jgi:hypothetical protein